MAKRTYEQLVDDFINEFGIGDGGPSGGVSGHTGDLGRAVRWIREANDYVNVLWIDWHFLWREWEGTLAANDQEPTVPTVGLNGFEFNKYDRKFFYLNYGQATYRRLEYQDYQTFRIQNPGATATEKPSVITVLPDLTLRVNKLADTSYTFHAEGWQKPVSLAADGDTPALPEAFERIIIARAAIYYANWVDAPEVLEGAEAEYVDLLEKLEANQLPDQQFNRMAAQDEDLTIAVPGQDSLSHVTR